VTAMQLTASNPGSRSLMSPTAGRLKRLMDAKFS
jgi:hypothetical protein